VKMNIKKFLAFAAAIVFLGVLSLSILAFTNSGSGNHTNGVVKATQFEQHNGTACDTTKAKSCCEKAGQGTSADCKHADQGGEAACPNHSDKTTDKQ